MLLRKVVRALITVRMQGTNSVRVREANFKFTNTYNVFAVVSTKFQIFVGSVKNIT